MSAVLLSTIARERLAPPKTVPQRSAEMLPLLKSTGTCRNLFGPVDHDELRQELSSKLREISERDQLRWNFNFSEGQPLDGDLKWEESRAEDCPRFYRETTAVSKRPFVDLPTTERIPQVAPKCVGRSMKILNQRNHINKCNRRKLSRKTVARVQTKRLVDMRITDFYGKRKKTDSVHKESGNLE
ncbi:cyclin-dependent kinase inhibitor 1C-like [Sinocyclocheilus anshuiensis]|uniref:Cyclin-dependent kinase inhibitor 1C-like n=1 Tax=Sinocyclocheilus anshuiensis TaxID=1608454 RepID=A0A671L5R1_9TELE|nr:PREDICTED: cyclin-dependent kinase inhibitor 1C-like [Sinocyclocheilus anshuiensis]